MNETTRAAKVETLGKEERKDISKQLAFLYCKKKYLRRKYTRRVC